MKFSFNKILLLTLFIFFISIKFVEAETLNDIASEINDIRKEISNLKSSDIKEAAQIDKAIKELDKVVDFINERKKQGDIKSVISSIDFAEESLKNVSKVIPSEFKRELLALSKNFK